VNAVVNVHVPDVAAAVDFYVSAIGVVLERYLDHDVAELSAGSDKTPNPGLLGRVIWPSVRRAPTLAPAGPWL